MTGEEREAADLPSGVVYWILGSIAIHAILAVVAVTWIAY